MITFERRTVGGREMLWCERFGIVSFEEVPRIIRALEVASQPNGGAQPPQDTNSDYAAARKVLDEYFSRCKTGEKTLRSYIEWLRTRLNPPNAADCA